jgi:hypothetical protein
MKTKPTQYGVKIWYFANEDSKYVMKLDISVVLMELIIQL